MIPSTPVFIPAITLAAPLSWKIVFQVRTPFTYRRVPHHVLPILPILRQMIMLRTFHPQHLSPKYLSASSCALFATSPLITPPCGNTSTRATYQEANFHPGTSSHHTTVSVALHRIATRYTTSATNTPAVRGYWALASTNAEGL